MGSRLEKVRQNVENASRIEQKGVEQGERDASEVREIKSIIEGMDRDVDDDIVEAMEATREAAKSEGADHMRTETHRTLESGYQVAQDAIQEGNDQAGRSRRAAADFSSVRGVSEFGSGTAESSAAKAENIADQFEGHAEQAKQEMEDTEDRYRNLLEDIMG
ncbi:MAG: hypothetical protein HFI11_06630 [Lachnospiraceae bacterium]|jgi:hypothetical protein|nr:hypothetical protein [Lachnospiraceae bacterium]